MGFYQFKPNKRAAEATLNDQLAKVEEEVAELREEFEADPIANPNLLIETWDVIYAAEGILRKFPKEQVQAARDKVVEKAKSRGDY